VLEATPERVAARDGTAQEQREDTAGVGAVRRARPSFLVAFRYWLRLGCINFGGPAGQIAIMHRELVDEQRWITDGQFLRALNFCMLLPGPEAQQLAIYIGWRLHGFAGGLVAGWLFVVPSIFVLLLLSWLSVAHNAVPAIHGLLYGVQATVVAIVLDAVLRVGKRILRHASLMAIAAAAFIAIYFLHASFPVVVGVAAVAGLVLHHWYPDVFRAETHGGSGGSGGSAGHAQPDEADAHVQDGALGELADDAHPTFARNAGIVGAFLVAWLVPVGLLSLWRGFGDVLSQEAWFFTKAAFVTFGGAYAVLSYMADQAVNFYRWVTTAEMVQGLGLAESTPGSLIMVTSYVGFLAAYKQAGGFPPALYGTLGALITVYATFLPCFLFVFLGSSSAIMQESPW
jgi:chromate transporter